MGFSALVRRAAVKWGPAFGSAAAAALRAPVFVVGYNKSGKSTLVAGLAQQPGVTIFPGEGNDVLWFRGLYPWPDAAGAAAPLWHDPDAFVRTAVASRADRFAEARAQLGMYRLLRAPASLLVNDSGMLAALLPELLGVFPDARIVHVVRDGRVVSAISARRTLQRIGEQPERYRAAGCPTGWEAVLAAQARYWCWTLDRVARVAGALPGAVTQVRYEDWCQDPVGVLRAVTAAIGARRSFRTPRWPTPVRNDNAEIMAALTARDLQTITCIQREHLARWGYTAEQY
jgi:hypothetical protein